MNKVKSANKKASIAAKIKKYEQMLASGVPITDAQMVSMDQELTAMDVDLTAEGVPPAESSNVLVIAGVSAGLLVVSLVGVALWRKSVGN